MKGWGRRVLLVLFWISAGALVASGISLALGEGLGTIAPFVVGIIGISFIGPLALIAGAKTTAGLSIAEAMKAKPGEPAPADAPRMIGRIESLREAGVTVRNFHHLFEIVVTTFPRTGRPKRETISQFITLGDLPNLANGTYVVIAASESRLVIDLSPGPQWADALRAAPQQYGRMPAAAEEPSTPVTVTIPDARLMKPARRALNITIVLVCVVTGATGSLLYAFNGADRLSATVGELPARWSGQVHGLWDSARLPLDLADLQDQIGDRELEHLIVFADFISLGVHSESDPIGIDTYALRNGRLDEPWASTASDYAQPFTVADIDAALVRDVTQRIYRETPGAEISDVYVRKSNGLFQLSVSIEGKYEDTSRVFDATTGEEIPQD
ncbi:hypothetical protein [Microbacterium sp. ZW T5_56]|uniref:hypothetical protein n=1 Tax=Microbacterium sp. ZW T5_56 TaxID=3378081 RepID=UPI003851D5D6